MKICPACGNHNNDSAAFCVTCGTKLGAPQQVQPVQPNQPVYNQYPMNNQNPKPSGGNKNAIIIAVVVAAAIIIGLIAAAFIIKGGNAKQNETAAETTVTESVTQPQTETTTQETTRTTTTAATTTERTTERTKRADAYDYSDEYLYPSDSRYITYDELDYMSRTEVRRVLNEMYARHGARFQKPENQKYFNAQSWYYATCSMEEAEKHFNKYERANRDTIVEYEKAMGWR